MAWKADAKGVLHWEDDPLVYTAQDRWEDPDNSDEGGGNNGGDEHDGGDHGGDSGGNDNGNSGDGGGDHGNNGNDDSGSNSDSNNGSDNSDSGGSNSGSSDSSGVDQQSEQARDTWAQQQASDDQQLQDNWNQNNNNFNQSFQQSTNNFDQQASQSSAPDTSSPTFNQDHLDLFNYYKSQGPDITGNENASLIQPQSEQARDQTSYTAPAYTPPAPVIQNSGSLISSPGQPQDYVPAPPAPNTPPDVSTPDGQYIAAQQNTNASAPEPDAMQDVTSPQTVTPPDVTGQSSQATAQDAAQHTLAAGGTPAQAASAAVMAASMVALDNQTLGQQSSWTRSVFRSTYGDNADSEWVKQHNAELQRNRALYGSDEPRTGTRPVDGAPAGTPNAPNRFIGATPPPGPGETAQYGVAPTARAPQPAPVAASASAPAATAPPPAPPSRAATAYQQEPQAPVQPGMNPEQRVPPGSAAVPRPEPTSFQQAPQIPVQPGMNPEQRVPPGSAAGPSSGISAGATPDISSTGADTIPTDTRSGPLDVSSTGADLIPSAPSAPPGTLVDPGSPHLQFLPDGSIRDAQDGRILGSFDPQNPPANLVPVTSMKASGFVRESAVGRTGDEGIIPTDSSALPADAVPGYQSGSRTGDALPGDVTPNPDRVATALDTTRPIDTLAELANSTADPTQQRNDAINITNGIGAMLRGDQSGAWAEPYLNDVARLAWAREERGNGRADADPRMAPDDYIEHWKDAFFGSDHSVPMVKELDQQMIDYAVDKTPPNKPFDWKVAFGPTGENGLISKQSTGVDCGPNAFATILRSRGYNADPAQTFSFAKQTGYHNGEEFTGPANMANMLQKEAGLDATDAPIKWSTVDSELDAGRPVVLSSPGHYWVVSARRDGANGEEYYAGQTANVVSNPSWSTQGQFRYGGAVTDMITAKGDVDPNARAVRAMNLPAPATSTGGSRQDLSPSQYRTPAQAATQRLSASMQPSNEDTGGGSVASNGDGQTAFNRPLRGTPDQIQNGTTGATQLMQDTTDNAPDRMGSTAVNPAADVDMSPKADPRIEQAANEDVWSPNQPARQALMQEFQQKPMDERKVLFENAMDQGLLAEGIEGQAAETWKNAMRSIVQGGPGLTAEDPDLNPYMITGEAGGRPTQAKTSSATGYFQLINTNPSGQDFAFRGYLPKEYNGNVYDPVGQVRQFVRAVNSSTYRGNPNAALQDKIRNGHYNIIVQRREPY